ncbi:hypothetical protein D3C71_1824410 [compost metagenome]
MASTIVAATLTLRPAADTTVTATQTGRTVSIYAATASTNAGGAGSRSVSTMLTFTVPGPFHCSVTLAAPTPVTEVAHWI